MELSADISEDVENPAVKRCAQRVIREFDNQRKEFPGGSFQKTKTDKKGNHRFAMTLEYIEDEDVLFVKKARHVKR